MLTGTDVRRYRKQLGLSQMDFARQVGIAQATLSQIEIGQITLSHDHLKKLERAFRGPTYELLAARIKYSAPASFAFSSSLKIGPATCKQKPAHWLKSGRAWTGSEEVGQYESILAPSGHNIHRNRAEPRELREAITCRGGFVPRADTEELTASPTT